MRFDELTRFAAALAGLGAIAIAGLTAPCFSERVAVLPTVCDGSTGACVVDIRDFAFEPIELRVRTGTTVTWTNREQQVSHTSTSDGPGWDSGILAPGQSFSRTFSAAGRFPYHCEPHPNMQATIVVE